MKKKKEEIIVERLNKDMSQGLSSQEVDLRVEAGLINKIQRKTSKSYAEIFIKNIFTFFNVLCFGIAAVLIAIGSLKNVGFMLIFLANLLIGLVQECRAKQTVDKISLITVPQVPVIRNGKEEEVSTDKIVIDDIVIFESGKQICADCIVLDGFASVNESLLTGESNPIKKKPGDTLLAGSFVVSGRCTARVDKVGEQCYSATLVKTAKQLKSSQSDLLRTLNLIIKSIAFIILPLGVLTFLDVYAGSGEIVHTIEKTAGSVIGMIPAGMFLLTSVALAVGVIKLARRRTLVQDLYSIEMLARADVLCLDKTGTITDGTMEVEKFIALENKEKSEIKEIFKNMMASFETYNQTSRAIIDFFGTEINWKKTKVFEFSSEKKYSAVEFEEQGTYVIGAPEFVCEKMTDEVKNLILDNTNKGLRVLMLAKNNDSITGDGVSKNNTPIALVVITDRVREDAIQTIKWFNENGVDIKIISGDNAMAVSKISKMVGIKNNDRFISLEGMSDDEVMKVATEYSIFGRVTPEQKCLLIKALKNAGHKVAMTGDGVNDILALKEADCSIAMASGSEATRSASNLVMLDSNFSSMPTVVAEGRRVINNISKSSSLFLMKTFFTIFLTVFVLCSPSLEYPFQPNQILLLETLFIGIPSFFLALQPNNQKVVGTFMSSLVSKAIPAGLVLTLNVMACYVFCAVTGQHTSIETLASIMVTFTGGVVLLKLCIPLDWYRGIMVFVLALSCVLILLFIPQSFFGYVTLSGGAKIFICICLVIAFFVYWGLSWLCDRYLRFDKIKFKRRRKKRA